MPSEIIVRKTSTGFFEVFIDGKSLGVYGNPAKAMNEVMFCLGYRDVESEE